MTEPEGARRPEREITRIAPDATALKALAHPVRLRILGMLRFDGPATATGLAARLELNSGATSYHLRQLAQHGFIEDLPDRGSRRDRWWRAKHESTFYRLSGGTREEAETAAAFAEAALVEQVRMIEEAQRELTRLPPAWQEAATASDFVFVLTPEQASSVKHRLQDLLMQTMRETPAPDAPRPPDAKVFTVIVRAFPVPGQFGGKIDETEE